MNTHTLINTPRTNLSPEQLAALGVRRLNKFGLVLECMRCEQTWAPTLTHQGQLPRAFWLCPNKCNW